MVFSGLLMRRHSDGSARAEPPHTSANPWAHVGVGERVQIDGEVPFNRRMGRIYSYPKRFVMVVMWECVLGRMDTFAMSNTKRTSSRHFKPHV
jgi:hypothetical protein